MNVPIAKRPGWLLAALFLVPAWSAAQGVDIEPNNSCQGAQFVGSPPRPYVIDGVVNGAPGAPDIDFYRFAGPPGDAVQLNLRGAASGAGTLVSPLLGIFDENCSILTIVDPTFGIDPQAVFRVPASGTFTAAATAFPDFGFTGAESSGSYQLTLSTAAVAESIGGRLVNAVTGAPVTGDPPNFGTAYLLHCTPTFGCNIINAITVNSDGSFLFLGFNDNQPLPVGQYQVYGIANGFVEFLTEVFEVGNGEARDLGDLPMQPISVIGSVRVRLVDIFTGNPISGFTPPFGVAELQRCDGDFCVGLAGVSADFDGVVLFDGFLYQLPPGEYRVLGFAEDYRQVTSSRFVVAEGQHVDIGELRLTPFPIRFGEATGCELTTAGGLCTFGIDVTNRGPGRFQGEAWATVSYAPNEFPFRPAQFQVGRRGAADPRPERLRLRRGETSRLEFTLPVPAGEPENSSICVSAVVGSGRQPQFENQGDRFLFCAVMVAGNLQVLPAAEGRKHYREMTQGKSRRPHRRD